MKRTLGKSGIEVSAMGMGCWAIGGPWQWQQPGHNATPAGWGKVDDNESIRTVHAAIDAGVTFFDTAANYGAGHSETILARALQGRRDEVTVATKFGHVVDEQNKRVYRDPDVVVDNIRTDVDNSLRRLQTDVIDLYQFHDGEFPTDRAAEVRDVLEDLVAEGKIRWYGWSTDSPERAAVFATGDHCTSIQFALNVIADNAQMRELCATHNLAGINKDPLRRGLLTGKFTATTTFAEDDIRSGLDFSLPANVERLELVQRLRQILTAGDRTMAQGAIGYIWALDPLMIPIPGCRNVQQATENAGAMALGPLDSDQMLEIDQILGTAGAN